MREELCRIVKNRNLGGKYFLMEIESAYISRNSKPGNFVMLEVSGSNDPLLKRPFGIFNADSDNFAVYYEVVGKGSELLSKKRSGDSLMVVGPLGNFFPETEGKNLLLIAGGRGIVPLNYVLNFFPEKKNISLLYGARSSNDLNFDEDLKKIGIKDIYFYTDDGSKYKKGFVTEDVKNIILNDNIDLTFSCGPDVMLEALAKKINDLKTENYVSLEAYMGCGFGICHSCVVEDNIGGYKKVCTDGPVFKMEDIGWQT
ncbi:MAG: dihydroorotate dehydrogenase electron transfer subunit [Acidobacteriota bacterium]